MLPPPPYLSSFIFLQKIKYLNKKKIENKKVKKEGEKWEMKNKKMGKWIALCEICRFSMYFIIFLRSFLKKAFFSKSGK